MGKAANMAFVTAKPRELHAELTPQRYSFNSRRCLSTDFRGLITAAQAYGVNVMSRLAMRPHSLDALSGVIITIRSRMPLLGLGSTTNSTADATTDTPRQTHVAMERTVFSATMDL